MLLIIALAIYGSIDVAMMAFCSHWSFGMDRFFASGYADVDDIIGL